MATAAPGLGAVKREVSLERIFSRGFGTIRANPAATLGIAFLFSALPTLVTNYALQGYRSPDFVLRVGVWGMVAGALGAIALWLVLSALTQGALVRATVGHSEGREASFGESVMAGLVSFVPLIALTIIVTLALMVGFILLIVPAIILYCILAVATPALVAERLGPIAAIRRSRYLTSGARWKIFGLTLIVVIGSWIVSTAVSATSMQLAGGVRAMALATMQGRIPFAYFAVQAVVQTVTSCIWSVLVSALYVELRDWKDGPRSANLAEVFA